MANMETKHVSELSEVFTVHTVANAVLYGWDSDIDKDKQLPVNLLTNTSGTGGSVDFVLFYQNQQYLAEEGDDPVIVSGNNTIMFQPCISTNSSFGQIKWILYKDGLESVTSNKLVPIFSNLGVGTYDVELSLLDNSGNVVHSKLVNDVFIADAPPPVNTFNVSIHIESNLSQNEELYGVDVTIRDIDDSQNEFEGTTDSNGDLVIPNVEPGEYRLTTNLLYFDPYDSANNSPPDNIEVIDQNVVKEIDMILNPYTAFDSLVYDYDNDKLIAIYQFLPTGYEGNTLIEYYLNDSPTSFHTQTMDDPESNVQKFEIFTFLDTFDTIGEGDTITAKITFKDYDNNQYGILEKNATIQLSPPEDLIYYFPVFDLSDYENADGSVYDREYLDHSFNSGKSFKNYAVDLDGNQGGTPYETVALKDDILTWLNDEHCYQIDVSTIEDKDLLSFTYLEDRRLDTKFSAKAINRYLDGNPVSNFLYDTCISIIMVPEDAGFNIFNVAKSSTVGSFVDIEELGFVIIENVEYNEKLYTMYVLSGSTQNGYDKPLYLGSPVSALTSLQLKYMSI